MRPPLLFRTTIAGHPRTCGVLIWDIDRNTPDARALARLAHHNIKATARGKCASTTERSWQFDPVRKERTSARAHAEPKTARAYPTRERLR